MILFIYSTLILHDEWMNYASSTSHTWHLPHTDLSNNCRCITSTPSHISHVVKGREEDSTDRQVGPNDTTHCLGFFFSLFILLTYIYLYTGSPTATKYAMLPREGRGPSGWASVPKQCVLCCLGLGIFFFFRSFVLLMNIYIHRLTYCYEICHVTERREGDSLDM